MSCQGQEYVKFDNSSLPNYYSKVIHDKREPPHCKDELKKKGWAWKFNGNRTIFLDCLNKSCSSGKTETCDYRDQFYLNDASKLESYTKTTDKQIRKLKKPDFFIRNVSEGYLEDFLDKLLNPESGPVDQKTVNYIKDNILYTEDGKCFYPISDAGANGRLDIKGESKSGLHNWTGTFRMKIPHNTFLKENRLNTGLSVNDDAIKFYPLANFISKGQTFMIPKEKQGGRRVSRKTRSIKKRSHRW
jgi:hypothetical protein